jgi:hypothetical protein
MNTPRSTDIGVQKQQALTHQRLCSMLSYDASTGEFMWLKNRGRARAGAVAGNVGAEGYVLIGIDGFAYAGHRLAWFYVHTEWPPLPIDHMNRCRTDNRIANLRCVTVAQNNLNSSPRPRGASGRGGFGFDRSAGLWRAYRTVDGKYRHLGYFPTENEAEARARQKD